VNQPNFARFVTAKNMEVTQSERGPHHWLSKPGLTECEALMLVRVAMPAGQGHAFHRHPPMEEIIYVVSGQGEQWVGTEKRILGPGDCAHIPRDMIHALYTHGSEPLVFLAILSPAKFEGPGTVDVYMEEPWKSLRPFVQG
jgi:quercetin dioxygenase-like cupin family protein